MTGHAYMITYTKQLPQMNYLPHRITARESSPWFYKNKKLSRISKQGYFQHCFYFANTTKIFTEDFNLLCFTAISLAGKNIICLQNQLDVIVLL
jgi:hypothetical protein